MIGVLYVFDPKIDKCDFMMSVVVACSGTSVSLPRDCRTAYVVQYVVGTHPLPPQPGLCVVCRVADAAMVFLCRPFQFSPLNQAPTIKPKGVIPLLCLAAYSL